MKDSPSPVFQKFTERNFGIVDVLLDTAKQIGRSPAQVALNWITRRLGVASTIIGATKLEQLKDNLAALEFDIPAKLSQKLDDASRPELVHPYVFFESPDLRHLLHGKTEVSEKPEWY